mmetsp:Transcript_15382/g.25098  ORF Transcript_15382/g.25098 Transcript_15382/m.25098 type:complete len:188 (-) Transcript_15382:938-1501(-)
MLGKGKMDGGPEFTHKRDPGCQYFEEMSRRCSSIEGGEGNLRCQLVKKLFRQCGQKPVEQVETLETESVEKGSGASMAGKFSTGSFGTFRGGFSGFGNNSMDESMGDNRGVVDPFDFFQRAFNDILSGESLHGSHVFNFGPSEAQQDADMRGDPRPPHHKHRYTRRRSEMEKEQNRKRWDNYESEDV